MTNNIVMRGLRIFFFFCESIDKYFVISLVSAFFPRSEHFGKGFAFYQVNTIFDLLGEMPCFTM